MSQIVSPADRVIRRLAPAKLNLTLEVVGRRADGYHLLDSLVAFAAVGDEIEARAAEDLSLTFGGPFGGVLRADTAENLVIRAARLLAAEAGIEPRAAMRLTKNLPLASGIGGGSSDAAAALLALSALWRLDMAEADLHRLGLKLGADVPVCLLGRTARLEGIGDILSPAPSLPAMPVVMVNPGKGLATPKVFTARTGGFSPGAGAIGVLASSPRGVADLVEALLPHSNDLTAPAIRLLPVIGEVLAALEAVPGCRLARMSGSGATCFALFGDDWSAASAAERLAAAHPDWWVAATSIGDG